MTRHPRIEANPKVMLGKPVVCGTRITVELIVRRVSQGASELEVVQAYPGLTVEDVRAALAYAADVIAREELILVDMEPRPAGS